MSLPLEDYGLVGDTQTAALVGRDGSIDWLCLPRFDSGACFAALLGSPENGRWRLAPAWAGEGGRCTRRRYRPGTLVLESEWDTPDGSVRVIDFMPPRGQAPDVVRVVEGLRGRVAMRMELAMRFDYGSIVPWVRSTGDGLVAVAGPDALHLRADVATEGHDYTTVATFEVGEGQRVSFVLTWYPSHHDMPRAVDSQRALAETTAWWQAWADRCTHRGEWHEEVHQSLVVLKALTYAPTGGIVAAATTSLPEKLGGVRNWDYRFCWLRDATFTLTALMSAGYAAEARRWRDWLLRAVAGQPSTMQIMYGPAGERRLPEAEIPWLCGYEGSRPVRVGNAAVGQFQLDVYGEVMDALYQGREAGIDPDDHAWAVQRVLLDFLESDWSRPDEGIWEVRGPSRHFTHSKVMAWVALDRAVRSVERFGLDGPVDRWRATRDAIHAEVCTKGFDADRRTFTQSYGSAEVDASLLLVPLVGFVPPNDERAVGTVAAIEQQLLRDGFVMRYRHDEDTASLDGLPSGEGAFLACTFWLADNYALVGRVEEARSLFERLLALRNDVGLLAEEYDPAAERLVGNFPQAFSHVALVNTALNLAGGGGVRLRSG